MSGGKSSSNTSSNSQSQSQQSLDPDIKAALFQNYDRAQNLVNGSSYQPVSASDISSFSNPYTASVISTTNDNLNLQRQQELEQNAGTAVAAHAYGGDRATVADALTNEASDRTLASTDAGLSAANFQQALTAAQTQNTQQNQYPLDLQELLNASLGLAGNPVLGQSSSTGSSSGSSSGINFGVKAG